MSLCNRALGLQNGRIRNSQITASSEVNRYHAAWLGRLKRVKAGRYIGAWCPKHRNHNQWFKVDFRRLMKITKIATQGRHDAGHWVTSYYLSSSVDNVHWAIYRFRSANQVFSRTSTIVCSSAMTTPKFSFFPQVFSHIFTWSVASWRHMASPTQIQEAPISTSRNVTEKNKVGYSCCTFIHIFGSMVYYKGLILLFVSLFSNSSSKQIVIKTALWPMQLIHLSERAMCVLIRVVGVVIHAWGQNFMDAQLVGSRLNEKKIFNRKLS